MRLWKRFFLVAGYVGMFSKHVMAAAKYVTQAALASCHRSNATVGPLLYHSRSLQPAFIRQFSTTSNQRPRLFSRLKRRHSDSEGGLVTEVLYRADRVLANRTGKSRSECGQWLKQRRVVLVGQDDNVHHLSGPSTKISMHANLLLDKTYKIPPLPPLLMVYHKPKWILSVRTDPIGRPCLMGVNLPKQLRETKMHPVGRLDYDSSGLLLFSSNGKLTQTLLHPRHRIPKEYVAVVASPCDEVNVCALGDKLRSGVPTSDGIVTAQLLEASMVPQKDVPGYLQALREELPTEYRLSANKSEKETEESHDDDDDANEVWAKRTHLKVLSEETTHHLCEVRLVVREGKYRMVRRLLANCGFPVVSLHRERIGEVNIGDLSPGQCRLLTEKETIWAHGLIQKLQKK